MFLHLRYVDTALLHLRVGRIVAAQKQTDAYKRLQNFGVRNVLGLSTQNHVDSSLEELELVWPLANI